MCKALRLLETARTDFRVWEQSVWSGSPAQVEPSDGCSPDRQTNCNLTKDPLPETHNLLILRLFSCMCVLSITPPPWRHAWCLEVDISYSPQASPPNYLRCVLSPSLSCLLGWLATESSKYSCLCATLLPCLAFMWKLGIQTWTSWLYNKQIYPVRCLPGSWLWHLQLQKLCEITNIPHLELL